MCSKVGLSLEFSLWLSGWDWNLEFGGGWRKCYAGDGDGSGTLALVGVDVGGVDGGMELRGRGYRSGVVYLEKTGREMRN